VGEGEGWASAEVWAPDCDLEGDAYELRPTFFGSEAQPGDTLLIRMQRGSDSPQVSDGILIQVLGASTVQAELLGSPIDLGADDGDPRVIMTLYLNETCPVILERPENRSVAYTAVAGALTFDAIYAPEASGSDKEIAARFDDVLLVDAHDPDNLRAVASGELQFLHVRGRPAQAFP
jgi:hypothetical protein